jgi:hypothetical protein
MTLTYNLIRYMFFLFVHWRLISAVKSAEFVSYRISYIIREEHRLRVFENRVLRKTFGPKRDEVRGC